MQIIDIMKAQIVDLRYRYVTFKMLFGIGLTLILATIGLNWPAISFRGDVMIEVVNFMEILFFIIGIETSLMFVGLFGILETRRKSKLLGEMLNDEKIGIIF